MKIKITIFLTLIIKLFILPASIPTELCNLVMITFLI